MSCVRHYLYIRSRNRSIICKCTKRFLTANFKLGSLDKFYTNIIRILAAHGSQCPTHVLLDREKEQNESVL